MLAGVVVGGRGVSVGGGVGVSVGFGVLVGVGVEVGVGMGVGVAVGAAVNVGARVGIGDTEVQAANLMSRPMINVLVSGWAKRGRTCPPLALWQSRTG